MTQPRLVLAEEVCWGLAGWLQLQAAHRLEHLTNEDAAKILIAQLVAVQGRYAPKVSQLPTNWGTTKLRVDVALHGRSAAAKGWYGAIEVKWPGAAVDIGKTREQIIQDVARVACVKTTNLNARFVILGGSRKTLTSLFDSPHRTLKKEGQRDLFAGLLLRSSQTGRATVSRQELATHFSEAFLRVPEVVREAHRGDLEVVRMAAATARLGGREVGSVYVWQCNWVRGRVGASKAKHGK